MSKFILVAETGSDIPKDLAQRYNIHTVPMHVAFGDETRDDGSFPISDIYDYFNKTKKLTKTSGCTPADFEKVFDEIQSNDPDKHILHLAYSAVTTCSYQSAIIAAEGRQNITSVDVRHVSAGQALVVILMARFLEAHPDCTVEEAVRKAEHLAKTCCMGFFPGDLAYLRAGGRVSNAAYLGAKILSLNPLIEVLDGHLKATKKYRGKMEHVSLKMMREYIERCNLSREIMAFVYSEGLSQSIKDNATALAEELGFREILWIPTGGVVTTHCGPGGFGVCGFKQED